MFSEIYLKPEVVRKRRKKMYKEGFIDKYDLLSIQVAILKHLFDIYGKEYIKANNNYINDLYDKLRIKVINDKTFYNNYINSNCTKNCTTEEEFERIIRKYHKNI